MPLSAAQSVGLCHHTQANELIAKADVFSRILTIVGPLFSVSANARPVKKLSSQESAEIRSHQDAEQTIAGIA
jgi:hypothetical protein